MSAQIIENSDPRTWGFMGLTVQSLAPITALSAKPTLGPAHIDFPLVLPAGCESVSNICVTGYVDLSFRPTVGAGTVLRAESGEAAPHPGTRCYDHGDAMRCWVPNPKWAPGSVSEPHGTVANQGLSLHVVQPDGSDGDAQARFSSRVPQSLRMASSPSSLYAPSKTGTLTVRLRVLGDLPSLLLFKLTAQAHFPQPAPAPLPAPAPKSPKGGKCAQKGGQ